MPEQGRSVLRVYGSAGYEVRQVAQMLNTVARAYEGIAVFEALLDRFNANRRYRRRYELFPVEVFGCDPWTSTTRGMRLSPSEVRDCLAPQDRLQWKAASFSSPGFWDFLGKLNPLEVIRLSINDHHERRKDREYREEADKVHRHWENVILENQAIRERIGLARELGARDEDLMPLVNPLLRSLKAVGRHQDDGLIVAAEMVDESAPDEDELYEDEPDHDEPDEE